MRNVDRFRDRPANSPTTLTAKNGWGREPSLAFVTPLWVTLLTVVGVPFVLMICLSATNYDLSGGSALGFIGLGNYRRALGDAQFWTSTGRTLVFSLVSLSVQLLLGTLIAYWLYRNRSVSSRLLPILIIPSLLPPIVVGLIWSFLLQSSYGPIIWSIRQLGFQSAQSPFATTQLALPALILVDCWQWTPFVAVLTYAGILSIPRSSIEAAMVDGAGEFQILRSIIIPQTLPAILSVILVRLLDLTREFDKPFILTGGGPSNSTELVSVYLWRVSFRYWNQGYAAALSLLVYLGAASFLVASYVALRRIRIHEKSR